MKTIDDPIAAPQVPGNREAPGNDRPIASSPAVAASPGAPPYTALHLAAMPIGEARAALSAQECAWMQEHHAGPELYDAARAALEEPDIARVYCRRLDGARFHWEAFLACGCCDTTGEVLGADGKSYECPACKDSDTLEFDTDYDGNVLEEPA